MDKCLIATFITGVNTSVVTTAELLEKQINTNKSVRSFFASSTFSSAVCDRGARNDCTP